MRDKQAGSRVSTLGTITLQEYTVLYMNGIEATGNLRSCPSATADLYFTA